MRGRVGQARHSPCVPSCPPSSCRAKVKKGVNVLSARTSEPREWDVRQERGNGGKHATTAVVCQRLAPGARNR